MGGEATNWQVEQLSEQRNNCVCVVSNRYEIEHGWAVKRQVSKIMYSRKILRITKNGNNDI